MTIISKLYHFLGGVRFAIVLIAAVALFVIAGTAIESHTQSHRYAARLTYGNPLFILLLWGFFINILFAATRRWPFRVRHIPFLITHLGLLMILAGALLKSYFGVQGTLGVMEGAGSHEIFETDSYVVQLEKKGTPPKGYPLERSMLGNFTPLIASGDDGLHLALADYAPHAEERFCTWVKGGHVSIAGLAPLPLVELADGGDLEESAANGIRLQPEKGAWNYYGVKSASPDFAVTALLKKHTLVRFTERTSGKVLAEAPLKAAMQHPIEFVDRQGRPVRANVNLLAAPPSMDGALSVAVEVTFERASAEPQKLSIPLDGSQALLNLNMSTPHLGQLPIAVDLVCAPTFAVIEDENSDLYLAAFDPHGNLWTQHFPQAHLTELYAYDDGHEGYFVRAELPFAGVPADRQQREDILVDYLKAQIKQAVDGDKALSPPLELLQQACRQRHVDFVDAALAFLALWNAQNSWLFPADTPLPPAMAEAFDRLDLRTLPVRDQKALVWAAHFFRLIDSELSNGKDILALLEERDWPLLSSLQTAEPPPHEQDMDSAAQKLTLLTQQMYALADALPPPGGLAQLAEASAPQKAQFFSAYLRAYAIHMSTIMPSFSADEMHALLAQRAAGTTTPAAEAQAIVLETSVVPAHRTLYPEKKLEDNTPAITLKAYKKGLFQTVSLAYSKFGSGLKWPILDGEYLVRFQPKFIELPYRVRLRSARQINYANTTQPFSFESDIIITDRRTGQSVEKTISMNNVHETWDGYRFYLANIAPPSEGAVKTIQLIVNHDPAKYWLTYPGACILTLGIVLLFWMRPYKKRTKDER